MFEEIQAKSYFIQLGSNCAAFPARCRPRRRRRRRRRGHHPSPKPPAPKPGVSGRDRTGWGGNSLLGVKAKALQLKLGPESRLRVGKYGWRAVLALVLSQGHRAGWQQGWGVCPPSGGQDLASGLGAA